MYKNEHTAEPLVSVIMPAYNAAPFIEEAIMSVLNQTVQDFELIVIDDCSTDNTADIIESISTKDRRVRFFGNNMNMGVAKTRNRGLDLFQGKYVALLDSDDCWEPCFLEKMLLRANESCADIIYCSYSLVDEQGKKVCDDFIVPLTTNFEQSIVRSVITCSTVLITADLARNNRFPINMYHEDIAMWFRILKEGGKACGVPEVLASYRQRAGSRSGDKIKSAIRRWPIYRTHLNMSFMQSVLAMIRYGYYGLIKYKRL